MTEQRSPAPGQDWEIVREGVIAGHLSLTGKDGLWHTGEFRPGDLFDEIADLFSKIDHHGAAKGYDERQADVHRLKQLNVQVRRTGDTESYTSFALFVESDQAKMRVYPSIKLC